jgi:NADH:ubiquinone oxidoreductase subunit B-like Fe-S oxidoreductase
MEVRVYSPNCAPAREDLMKAIEQIEDKIVRVNWPPV